MYHRLVFDDSTATTLNLDDYMTGFETGLTDRSLKMNDIFGDGGIVSGTGSYGGRIFTVSRAFLRTDEATKQAFLDWFSMPLHKKVFIERVTTAFTGRTYIKPSPSGGESYKIRNYNMVEPMTFKMFAEDPYFTSTSLTSSTAIPIISTAVTTKTFTISGSKNYCIYALTATSDFSELNIRTNEGYGFYCNYSFLQTDTISISTTGNNLSLVLNGDETYGNFSSLSTPFELNSSDNTLYIQTDSTSSIGITISYYERRL